MLDVTRVEQCTNRMSGGLSDGDSGGALLAYGNPPTDGYNRWVEPPLTTRRRPEIIVPSSAIDTVRVGDAAGYGSRIHREHGVGWSGENATTLLSDGERSNRRSC